LIHPLAVAHPETLVRVAERHPPLLSWEWFPYRTYQAIRPMRSFDGVAVEGDVDTVVSANGGTQPVVAEMVSGNYFALLGVKAEFGRALNHADEQGSVGNIPVVLSHRFWTH
jgi:putative ABC transport system permease protein